MDIFLERFRGIGRYNTISLNDKNFLAVYNGYIFQYEINNENKVIRKNSFKCNTISFYGKYPGNKLVLAYLKTIYIYGN